MTRLHAVILALAAGLIVLGPAGAAMEPPPTLQQVREGKVRGFPPPPAVDLMIIKDGYRMFSVARDHGWPGIKAVSPAPTLLVTETAQYLMGHPQVPDDHYLVELDERYFMNTFGRETTLGCDLTTARPLFGTPTIILGSSACRDDEVITTMAFEMTRLCFRLYLYSQREPMRAARLQLPFPDPEERWKSTIGFPYDDPEVVAAIRDLGKVVSDTFWMGYEDQRAALLEGYLPARERVRAVLEARSGQHSFEDFFRFITWSEGVAHFGAYQGYRRHAKNTGSEDATLRALEGWIPYRAYTGGQLKRSLQRFRTVTDEPLTLDDLRILGSMTAGIVDHYDDRFEERIVANGVWLEDLMARLPSAN